MAYPAGVTTRNIAFSNPAAFESGDNSANKIRVVVRANSRLVHISTGIPILPVGIISAAGVTTLALPVTDQTGIYNDANGVAKTSSPTHTYWVDIEYLIGTKWTTVRTIKSLDLPTSGSDLDLDLILNTNTIYS